MGTLVLMPHLSVDRGQGRMLVVHYNKRFHGSYTFYAKRIDHRLLLSLITPSLHGGQDIDINGRDFRRVPYISCSAN